MNNMNIRNAQAIIWHQNCRNWLGLGQNRKSVPWVECSTGPRLDKIFAQFGLKMYSVSVQCHLYSVRVQCMCTVYSGIGTGPWHSTFILIFCQRERYLNLFSISKKYFSKPEPFPVWLISILVDAMGCLRQFLFEYSVPSVCSLCA